MTGFPAPVLTWQKIPASLPKDRTIQDKGLLTVGLAEKHDIGSYVCHAKNALGETSAVTSLFVWTAPKFITTPPQNVVKIAGEDLSPSISWKRSGRSWEKERTKVNEGILQISSLSKVDSGIYICEAKVPYYTIEARTELVVTDQGKSKLLNTSIQRKI